MGAIKLIVAGSRNWNDSKATFDLLDRAVGDKERDIEVVCGGARGVDVNGKAWALARGYPVIDFPADWDTHGKAAGLIRNADMALYATHALIMWDGESKGTKHMIDLCVFYGLRFCVVFKEDYEHGNSLLDSTES